jgi:hypothetical protein
MIKVSANRGITYSIIPKDVENWVDAGKYIPEDFDLCLLKIKGREKVLPGWASGLKFDGAKINPDDEILFWKKVQTAKGRDLCL